MKNTIILCMLYFTILSNLNATELRKKIVVLDTGLHVSQMKKSYLCKNGIVSTVGDTAIISEKLSSDQQAHGQNVIGLIGSRIDVTKYCIVSVRVYTKHIQPLGYLKGLNYANSLYNVVAVNISSSGESINYKHNPYLMEEHAQITKLIHKGVKVIVAAGNSHKNLSNKNCSSFPACLKFYYDKLDYGHNFIVVGSKTTPASNASSGFTVHLKDGYYRGTPPMGGTSQATAIFTGEEFSK